MNPMHGTMSLVLAKKRLELKDGPVLFRIRPSRNGALHQPDTTHFHPTYPPMTSTRSYSSISWSWPRSSRLLLTSWLEADIIAWHEKPNS